MIKKQLPGFFCGNEADPITFQEKHPHIKVVQLKTEDIQLEDVMNELAQNKIQSLYVEGGGTIHQAFLQENLVDECHWYIAPKLLGGQDARSVIAGNSPHWMEDAKELTFIDFEKLGPDLKIIAKPKGGF